MVEQLMLSELREICARYSTDELQITVFHPFFIYIDQYLAIMPQTLQTIFVTTAVMVVISLLLFQNIVCALVVFFSIVSIEIGVIGEPFFLLFFLAKYVFFDVLIKTFRFYRLHDLVGRSIRRSCIDQPHYVHWLFR